VSVPEISGLIVGGSSVWFLGFAYGYWRGFKDGYLERREKNNR
jgi:hypothetical protein